MYSVFEVKNIGKEGFELYNLVNEKLYSVKSQIKIVNYRRIFKGNYVIGEIIPSDEGYLLSNISEVLKASDSLSAHKLAVSIQTESPHLAYEDNDEKVTQIEEQVSILNKKFNEFFKKDEVVTFSTKFNGLMSALNDYIDGKDDADPGEFIEEPVEFAYDMEVYDVGLLYDPENGLQVVPYYATFRRIFEIDDYKTIKDYEKCVKTFFTDAQISPYVIKKVYELYGQGFLARAAEILKIEEQLGFEDLMQKYKGIFYKQKIFSVPTVLYSSNSFEKIMEDSEKPEPAPRDDNIRIGRNDPCYCGSGKKYKKCCL